ncbi:glycerophosphodiester phosphodiesterase [Paenibacillus beijingensis]|uniref:Glycerophosphodiester phosphodiesterase n=1 Tax=Paenibacillus beijingensis TaxID=1126833 RepID=A0A0D5NDS6_9BACL|nr:glycerophosphodiester phosphodiesterase family protein [Paenibacillus beijingensis]AJY73391.1 glycerophosphodiester phosphodiesterase [Paenibacillus beijingensis]
MRNPCVAHRGWSGAAPENTLSAIRLAADAPDVDWIEIDVRISRDGIPMLIHDAKLRRTTSGSGEVSKYTAQQLSKLDAGRWFSREFTGEKMPTLEQALLMASGKVRVNIELKTDGKRYPDLENKVVELLRRLNMEQNCVITSFSAEALHKVRSLSRDVTCGLIVDRWSDRLPDRLNTLGCRFLSIGYGAINKERLKRLNREGIQTMVWTLNEVRLIRKYALMDPGLMICTNHPDLWRAALRSVPQL